MGKSTISMVIFNSYFDKLPEGKLTTLRYLGYQGFDPCDPGKMEDIIDIWLGT